MDVVTEIEYFSNFSILLNWCDLISLACREAAVKRMWFDPQGKGRDLKGRRL